MWWRLMWRPELVAVRSNYGGSTDGFPTWSWVLCPEPLGDKDLIPSVHPMLIVVQCVNMAIHSSHGHLVPVENGVAGKPVDLYKPYVNVVAYL